jgi:hypothetical protein
MEARCRDRALAICGEAMAGTASRIGALPELPVRLVDVMVLMAAYEAKFGTRKEDWQ